MTGKLKLSMLSGASQMKGQVSHFKEILNQKNSRIEAVKVAKFTKSPKWIILTKTFQGKLAEVLIKVTNTWASIKGIDKVIIATINLTTVVKWIDPTLSPILTSDKFSFSLFCTDSKGMMF